MGCEFESTTVLPQWHVKDPGHSAKSAGGRLHLCTHAPLTQQSRIGLAMLLSRDNVGTYTENELTRNLSGNIRPWSSQLAEPHWTGPGIKSGISVRELISTLKKKKGAGWEWMVEHSSKDPCKRGKRHHQQPVHHECCITAKHKSSD